MAAHVPISEGPNQAMGVFGMTDQRCTHGIEMIDQTGWLISYQGGLRKP